MGYLKSNFCRFMLCFLVTLLLPVTSWAGTSFWPSNDTLKVSSYTAAGKTYQVLLINPGAWMDAFGRVEVDTIKSNSGATIVLLGNFTDAAGNQQNFSHVQIDTFSSDSVTSVNKTTLLGVVNITPASGTWNLANVTTTVDKDSATAAITSGTIIGVTLNNSVIGGSTPLAGTFTTLKGDSLNIGSGDFVIAPTQNTVTISGSLTVSTSITTPLIGPTTSAALVFRTNNINRGQFTATGIFGVHPNGSATVFNVGETSFIHGSGAAVSFGNYYGTHHYYETSGSNYFYMKDTAGLSTNFSGLYGLTAAGAGYGGFVMRGDGNNVMMFTGTNPATPTTYAALTTTGLGVGMVAARALDVTGTFGATGAATFGSTVSGTTAIFDSTNIGAGDFIIAPTQNTAKFIGRVGIGVNPTATYLLHTDFASASYYWRMDNGYNGNDAALGLDSNDGLQIYTSNGASGLPILFLNKASSAESARLTADGALAVGTTNPGYAKVAITGGLAIGIAATDTAMNGKQLRVNNGATFSEMVAGDVSFTTVSERDKKENLSPVDPEAVVTAFKTVPTYQYNYKASAMLNIDLLDKVKVDTTGVEFLALPKMERDSIKQAKRELVQEHLSQAARGALRKRIGPMAEDFYKVAVLLRPTQSDSMTISGDDRIAALEIVVKYLLAKVDSLSTP